MKTQVPRIGSVWVTFKGTTEEREYFVGRVWKDDLLFWAQEKPVKGRRRRSAAYQTFFWSEENQGWGMMNHNCPLRYFPCTLEFFDERLQRKHDKKKRKSPCS